MRKRTTKKKDYKEVERITDCEGTIIEKLPGGQVIVIENCYGRNLDTYRLHDLLRAGRVAKQQEVKDYYQEKYWKKVDLLHKEVERINESLIDIARRRPRLGWRG